MIFLEEDIFFADTVDGNATEKYVCSSPFVLPQK